MNQCDQGRDHHAVAQMAVTARQLTRIAGRLDELRSALESRGVEQGCANGGSSDMGSPPLDKSDVRSASADAPKAPPASSSVVESGCACATDTTIVRAKQLSRKLSRLARQVGRQLEGLELASNGEAPVPQALALKSSPELQNRLIDAFALQGMNREVVAGVIQDAANENPPAPWRATLKSIIGATDGIAALGRDTGDGHPKATASPPKSDFAGSEIGSSAQGLDATGVLVAIANAAVAGVVRLVVTALLDLLADLFNADDDDRSRQFIKLSPCGALRAMTTEGHYRLMLPMLEGPTGDDDERAILQLLNCLRCDQVRALFYLLDRRGWSLLDEFHGPEFERLLIRLQACGILAFSEWDDDTTRRYVMDHQFDCATLGQLPLEHLRTLVRNLFSGHTGAEDEAAILVLVRCQSCARRRQLVQMPGMSVDDFDDEVDGAEWTRLRALFRACGIPVG